jgi:hypothetical protein
MLKLLGEKRAESALTFGVSADFPALRALVYEPFGQAV